MPQKILDRWPGAPGLHAIAHQLGIPASVLASLRAGEMVAVRKDAVLALTDCVDCLTLFADEGISMTPESFNSDPQDVLCRLMKAVGVPESGEWGDCAAFVRDLAAAQPRRDEDTPDAPR